MINKNYLKLLRSNYKLRCKNFIYDKISERLIDSLDLINVDFKNILEIGINDNKIHKYLKKKYPFSNISRVELASTNEIQYYKIDDKDKNFTLENNFYNLIYSNFYSHLCDDFSEHLQVIYNGLNQNSFFIAALPDYENIYQLVNSMYRTDVLLYGGVYRRINPTNNVNDVLRILKDLNYDSPSIHSDNINIEYSNFKDLLNDVRTMQLSYCFSDKKKKFEKRNYFNKVQEDFKKNYFDQNYNLTVKMNIISAWKK